MPVAAALATGLPLLVGAGFDRLDYGLVSSLGGLVFLYLPETPLHHRMVSLMACAFAMIASYALGAISHFFAPAIVPMLAIIAVLVSMVCRFYRVGPPGGLFFIMAAAIGAYTPIAVAELPLRVGLVAMGALLGCIIAFFYSLFALRLRAPQSVAPRPPPTFDFVVFDSVIIGLFVGISLALAQVLQLERSYWVPVSCLAVIQGASLRAIWNKQAHRIVGTGIGLLLAWGLLLLPLNKWSIGMLVMALTFVIEISVVRHYGCATIFITPLTILLAEAVTFDRSLSTALVQARFFDTVLGCVVGMVGGFCLHSPRFRELAGSPLRRLIPNRLRRS